MPTKYSVIHKNDACMIRWGKKVSRITMEVLLLVVILDHSNSDAEGVAILVADSGGSEDLADLADLAEEEVLVVAFQAGDLSILGVERNHHQGQSRSLYTIVGWSRCSPRQPTPMRGRDPFSSCIFTTQGTVRARKLPKLFLHWQKL